MNNCRRIFSQAMSLRDFNRMVCLLTAFLLLTSSCKEDKEYIYEVDSVPVETSSGDKRNVKSTTEFITIAWKDLFGSSISTSELIRINSVYLSFGDKKLIEDRIILNMLNQPGLVIPAVPHVNGDTAAFIQSVYRKFYNRDPDAMELFFLKEQIRSNPQLSPTMIYYSFLTSDEYRYY